MNANERSILIVTCFGHFMSHFNMLVFPALVLPLTSVYQMDLAQVLALSFWMYMLYGVTALPWGMLSDKVGAKYLLLIYNVGAGISSLIAAFFLHYPLGFSLALAGVGLFSGIYHPAGLGLISRGISRMSIALGYNGVAGNAGLASAPLLAGIINYLFGTQFVFVFLSFCNFLGALLMISLPVYEPSGQIESKEAGDRSKLHGFILLCACVILVGIVYRGVSVILPSYFELRNEVLFEQLSKLRGLLVSRNVAATVLTSLVFVAGMVGQFLGGVMAERHDPRKGYFIFHGLTIPAAFFMAYATDIPLFLVSIIYFFFFLGVQPVENTLVAKLSPDKFRHSAYGTKFILNFGIGSLAVPFVGWIEQIWSLSFVFIVMAGISLLIVLLTLSITFATRSLRF